MTLMKKNNVTAKQLTSDLGLSVSSVTDWKKGKGKPSAETITKIAEYFGVTTDYLLGFDITKLPGYSPLESDIVEFEEIGVISAGYDGAAVECHTGKFIQVPAKNLPRGHQKDDFFVLRIKGNSMYPLLMEGDSILVERCDTVDSGSLAVVLYNGYEATVKRVKYVYGEDWLELIPANPEYPVKRLEGTELQECRVLGKVIKLISREL